MDGFSPDHQLTAEFVKFLNTQLKECRDQLQAAYQENLDLRKQLADQQTVGSHGETDDSPQKTVSGLEVAIVSLRAELAEARATAEENRKEAEAWRLRYEKSKTGTLDTQTLADLRRKATEDKLTRSIREELEQVAPAIPGASSEGVWQQYTQFRTFMSELSGAALPETHAEESRVVFDLPKLQLLPNTAVQACDGRFDFFGDLLKWCPSPSLNALLVCPERRYAPRGGTEGGPSWTDSTRWTSLVGRRYEIFDTDGGRLVYAGTFLFHAGPKALRLSNLMQSPDEGTVRALAHHTFNPQTKSQRTKGKAHLHALAALYRDGSATVQVLGLQRVGFNDRFFEVLRKAYGKRTRHRPVAYAPRSETQRSASPLDWGEEWVGGVPSKRVREPEDEEQDEEGGGAGPSKARRRGEILAGLF